MSDGAPELEEGTTLAGKIRIGRRLGRGGMGTVYEAVNEAVDRPVAVKVLRADLATDPGFAARFKREARATGRLRHPHIVDVLDFGVDEGRAYLVMELLHGETLGERIQSGGPLPVAEAIELLGPVLGAVGVAHEAGIVHRDLKPENLFLADLPGVKKRVPKVLDFGVAKVEHPDEERLTATRTSVGTAAYMAPEQVRSSRDVGPAADQYALGVVLYEALTGDLPHAASSYNEMIVAKVVDPPRPLSKARPDLPEAFCSVVMRTLEAEPEARFDDVAALRSALEPFADLRDEPPAHDSSRASIDPLAATMDSGERPSEHPDPPIEETSASTEPDRAPTSARDTGVRSRRFTPRNPVVWATVVAALTAVLGVVGVSNLRDGEDGTSVQRPATEDPEEGVVAPVLPRVLRLTEAELRERRRQLTWATREQIRSAAISPAGERLAYVDDDGLYVSYTDSGSRPAPIVTPAEGSEFWYVEWSANGRELLVTEQRDDDSRNLLRIDYNARQPRLLRADAWSATPAPDGSAIAYLDQTGVHVMDPHGEDSRHVYQRQNNPEEWLSELAWSPDGMHIAFATRHGGAEPRLLIVDIREHAELDARVVDERQIPNLDVEYGDPVWHPDDWVLYTLMGSTGGGASMQAVRVEDKRFVDEPITFPGCMHERCFVTGASAAGDRLLFETAPQTVRVGVASLDSRRWRLGELSFPIADARPHVASDVTDDSILAMLIGPDGLIPCRYPLGEEDAGCEPLARVGSFPTLTGDRDRVIFTNVLGEGDGDALRMQLVSRDPSRPGDANTHLGEAFDDPSFERLYADYVPHFPPHSRRYECNAHFGCVLSIGNAEGTRLDFYRLDAQSGDPEDLRRVEVPWTTLPYMWRLGSGSEITMLVHHELETFDLSIIDLETGAARDFEVSEDCAVHSLQLLRDDSLLAVCRPPTAESAWRLVRYARSGASPQLLWSSVATSLYQPIVSESGNTLAASFSDVVVNFHMLDARGLDASSAE